jgi:hypothetical protein
MRILRVRRGFTTNSSAANEFLPDGGVYDGGTPAGGKYDGGVSPTAPISAPVIGSVQLAGDPPSASGGASSGATLGAAALLVTGAFLVIPAVRLLRKRREKKAEEGSGER